MKPIHLHQTLQVFTTQRRSALILAGAVLVGACSDAQTGGDAPASGGSAGRSPGTGGATGTAGGGKSSGGAPGSSGGNAGGGTAGQLGAGGTGTGGAGIAGANTGGTPTFAGSGGQGTSPDVTVQLAELKQKIRGFGINNNWAPLGTDAQRLFGNGADQLGLNILRVGMGSDGNPYNGQSCYSDINAVVSQVGQRGEPHYIIATLWSPPPSCKSNGKLADGGYLLPSCYDSWSTTIAAFADKIEQNTSTKLYAMSPQNETDFASCGRQEPCNGNYDTTVMTGKEAANFQKIVGPKLRAKGVVPMSVEASEWIHVWSNESACCSEPSKKPSSDPLKCGFPPTNPACLTDFGGYDYGHALYADPDAWAAFDIMGTHQYDTQVAEPWPGDVPKGNKEVWQTEMSGVKWWPEQGSLRQDASAPGGWAVSGTTTIENGVAVARWIHSAMTVGEANAWLYWWYRAIDTDDNEGLLTKSGQTAKRFYTFGNFSKFVRPDYQRVGMTGNVPDKVLISAYASQTGTVVVVAINEATAAAAIPITIAGGTAPSMLTPHVTSATDDLAAKPAVPVTGGVFMAALPAMSVTTFVGQ